MNCEICSKPVDMFYEEDRHEDESGLYHYACWEAETNKEAQAHLRSYNAKKAQAIADEVDGYEWGNAKNAHYVAWAIEQADATRG